MPQVQGHGRVEGGMQSHDLVSSSTAFDASVVLTESTVAAEPNFA